MLHKQVTIIFVLLWLAGCGGAASNQPDSQPAPPATVTETMVAPTPPPSTPTQPPPDTPTAQVIATEAADETTLQPAPTQAVEAAGSPSEDSPAAMDSEMMDEGEAASVDWLTVEGKTEDQLAYLGNPDAPITIIDYSDFL